MSTVTQGQFDDHYSSQFARLRQIAHSILRARFRGLWMDTIDVCAEAYCRLADRRPVPPGRTAFRAAFAEESWRLLHDARRKESAKKRGARAPHVPLDEARGIPEPSRMTVGTLLSLQGALNRLREQGDQERRAAEAVWYWYHGMTHAQIAEILKCDERTVRRLLTFGFAWLKTNL